MREGSRNLATEIGLKPTSMNKRAIRRSLENRQGGPGGPACREPQLRRLPRDALMAATFQKLFCHFYIYIFPIYLFVFIIFLLFETFLCACMAIGIALLAMSPFALIPSQAIRFMFSTYSPLVSTEGIGTCRRRLAEQD